MKTVLHLEAHMYPKNETTEDKLRGYTDEGEAHAKFEYLQERAVNVVKDSGQNSLSSDEVFCRLVTSDEGLSPSEIGLIINLGVHQLHSMGQRRKLMESMPPEMQEIGDIIRKLFGH